MTLCLDGPTPFRPARSLQLPLSRRVASLEEAFSTVPSSLRIVRRQQRQASQHPALLHGTGCRRNASIYTNISAADCEQYDRVLAQFYSFKVRRKVIFERAKFNRTAQQRGESVEQFTTAFYHLTEMCEYGALRDEMLRAHCHGNRQLFPI